MTRKLNRKVVVWQGKSLVGSVGIKFWQIWEATTSKTPLPNRALYALVANSYVTKGKSNKCAGHKATPTGCATHKKHFNSALIINSSCMLCTVIDFYSNVKCVYPLQSLAIVPPASPFPLVHNKIHTVAQPLPTKLDTALRLTFDHGCFQRSQTC